MTQKEKEKEIRQKAKASLKILQQKGWIKGAFFRAQREGNRPAGYCAMGAIASVFNRTYSDARTELERRFQNLIRGGDIIDWNDRERRRKGDVLKVFQMLADGKGAEK